MSTKIYNGLKIKADSLDEAIQIVDESKSLIVNLYNEGIIKKEFFSSVYVMCDYLVNQKEILKEHFNIESDTNYEKFNEKESALTIGCKKILDSDLDCGVDSEISMVMYPKKLQIGGSNYYLLTIYASNTIQKDIKKIYKKNISEYAYWDNSDRPEGITKKSWEERKKNWEDVLLSKSSIPSVEGLTIGFISQKNPTAYLSPEDKVKNIEKLFLMEKDYKGYAINHKISDMMIKILSHQKNTKLSPYSLVEKIRNKDFTGEELKDYEKLNKIVDQKIPEELTSQVMLSRLIDLKDILKIKEFNEKLNSDLINKTKQKAQKL